VHGVAGVEADTGISGDEGIVGKARVLRGVFDDEGAVAEDRVPAEGNLARGLGYVEALDGFEPLAAAVDERDGGDGHADQPRGEAGDALEALLEGGLEQVEIFQRLLALGFVGRKVGSNHHGQINMGAPHSRAFGGARIGQAQCE